MKILKSRIKNPFPMKVRCDICKSKLLLDDIKDTHLRVAGRYIFWTCADCGTVNKLSISRSNKIRAWIGSDKRKREGNHE